MASFPAMSISCSSWYSARARRASEPSQPLPLTANLFSLVPSEFRNNEPIRRSEATQLLPVEVFFEKVREERYTGTHDADIPSDDAIWLAYSNARNFTLGYTYFTKKTWSNSHVRSVAFLSTYHLSSIQHTGAYLRIKRWDFPLKKPFRVTEYIFNLYF